MATQTAYKADLEDWTFHGILPAAAYARLFISALVVPHGGDATPPRALGPSAILPAPAGGFMAIFIVGLLLFLGVHSTRIFADTWRTRMIARIGEKPWKGIYSLLSLAGFVLMVWGYGQVRGQMPLWNPPAFMRYVTAVLMIPVFMLFVAPYVPGNALKAKVHHPQALSAKLWAFGHLLSNGFLADVVLFGAVLAWSILSYSAGRRRDRAAGTVYPPGTARGTIICVVVGLVIYAAFLLGLHRWLIGVPPL